MQVGSPLRALDVATGRVKSTEVVIAQGQWSQAALLELVLPEDKQRAFLRQELKAAQEHKSELKLKGQCPEGRVGTMRHQRTQEATRKKPERTTHLQGTEEEPAKGRKEKERG